MNDAEVIRVFSELRSKPEKYLRINISPKGAYIHLPDNQVHLSISRALLAEFVDHERLFFYNYDSQTSRLDPDFRCLVAMRKNRELAYVSGTRADLFSNYIHCKDKEKGSEYVEDFDKEENKTDSIFFGVVSTKLYTVIFSADNRHTKTLQIELLRADENQPSLEDIISTLNQLVPNTNMEVSDGEE